MTATPWQEKLPRQKGAIDEMERIQWVKNTMPPGKEPALSLMTEQQVEEAAAFHRSFPQYAVTPLASLEGMAGMLGVGKIFVKDESHRFGLNAFKVLGGSFAIGRYLAEKTGREIASLGHDVLTSEAFRAEVGQTTFVTATDGNHGKGIAWTARQLGQRARVFMPKGSTSARFRQIAAEGAVVTIEPYNYDDCVRLAHAHAASIEGGVLVQDTAWEGYEQLPGWIMQGYGTMAKEAAEQLLARGEKCPTHIFLQAGVGSLAGAVQGYFFNRYPDAPPTVVIVEASAADCLYQGARAGDGTSRKVEGELSTVMAGLSCGEPNIRAWEILRNHSTAFVSCPDWVTERGMRLLAAPLPGDPQVISGESGAVGMGLLATLLTDASYADLREAIGLGSDSRVLLFSTEGDTDPAHYRKVVWGIDGMAAEDEG